MTNKINGIDVSECYAENKIMKYGLYCFWEGGNCADNEFCYFKQLKRLQEENEELKKQLEFSRTHKTVLDAERIKYKQALEEIRNIAETPIIADENRFDEITNKIDEVLNER